MAQVNIPKMGIYQHYKGPLYQVLSLAHDADNSDRVVVVYMPLQLDGAHLGPRMAVRTIEHFQEAVHRSATHDNWPACPGPKTCPVVDRWPEGGAVLAHWDETHAPRFRFLGPMLTSEMLPGVTL